MNKAWSVSFPWWSLALFPLQVFQQPLEIFSTPFQIIEGACRLLRLNGVLHFSPGQKGRQLSFLIE